MITHLLDTNIAISLLAGRSEPLLARVLAHPHGQLAFSVVVVHELYYGAYKSQRVDHNLETVRLLLRDFPVLQLDQEDAVAAGEIRAALALRGKPVGPLDLLIAGQARARDLVMVTNNLREFERVPGLRVEDWLH